MPAFSRLLLGALRGDLDAIASFCERVNDCVAGTKCVPLGRYSRRAREPPRCAPKDVSSESFSIRFYE
jgi:hypothetical protein